MPCRCRRDGSCFLEATPSQLGPAGCCAKFGACLCNALLAPFILTYHAITIYLLPCIGTYFLRCCGAMWERLCCRACFYYTDSKFPPTPASLGDLPSLQRDGIDPGKKQSSCCSAARTVGGDVRWVRGRELVRLSGADAHPVLFENRTSPSDVAQGQLGDCWLLSALATLAETKGGVRKLFDTTEYSRRGKYTVHLYDDARGAFTKVTVDDWFPVHRDKPMFAAARGNELWVAVLEKAFAKLFGSYALLERGQLLWALRALTGDEVFMLSSEGAGGGWRKLDMLADPTMTNSRQVRFVANPVDGYPNPEELIKAVKQLHAEGCLLGAGTKSDGQPPDAPTAADVPATGLLPSHAYSVLRVVHEGGQWLIKLRNPWGAFEWRGDWSDASPMWEAHPDIAKACGYKPGEDGLFWISLPDFVRHFDQIHVCRVSRDVSNLVLDHMEERGCVGPCCGCLRGCAAFWCCCRGCRYLCCGRQHKAATVLHSDAV